MHPGFAKLPVRTMALAPHCSPCSRTRKPTLSWHNALVRDDSANQHGAWIPTYICLPRAQTGSTVSGCPERRKLRPREDVWDSLPGAASISCTKIIFRKAAEAAAALTLCETPFFSSLPPSQATRLWATGPGAPVR